MTAGVIFNVQRFSVHDGPGLRSTVFMKGCPLRCAWCHNPESQPPAPAFVRLSHRCMRCERCSEADLAEPVVAGRGMADVDRCPTGALQSVGERVDAATLVPRLLRDRPFFDESGGGVTVSGGEPLMQAPFVTDLLRRLRAAGVHTALDTCGFSPWPVLRDAAAEADLVLFDVKLMDDTRHRAATGVSNRPILANLEAMSRVHPAIWVRLPIVPGHTDDESNIDAVGAFLRPLPGIARIDLLPYHPTGESKFARVGLECAVRGTPTPTADRLAILAARLRAAGLTMPIGDHP